MSSRRPTPLPFVPVFDRVAVDRGNQWDRVPSPLNFHGAATSDIPRVIADDVAAWVLDRDPDMRAKGPDPALFDGLGPIRMPYQLMWVEWAYPFEVNHHAPDPREAWLLYHLTAEEARSWLSIDGDPESISPLRRIFETGQVANFMVGSRCFSPGPNDQVLPSDWITWIATDHHDRFLGYGTLPGGIPCDGTVPHDHIDPTESAHFTIATIGMVNCKNVVEKTHERPAKVSKKQRRPKPGGLRYSTIALPGNTYLDNGLLAPVRSTGDGTKVAAHICRGHFKTYTAAAPRFGRPEGVGTFWINAHARGSSEAGQVQSTYTVAPTSDDTTETGPEAQHP